MEPHGDKLAVIPAELCPPDFAEVLRQHKREILSLLEGKTAGIAPDCAPWLHVARQILDGEFVGCDSSTRETLTIALRSIEYPSIRRALERLGEESTRP